jgi:hypothetical protein
MIRRIGHIEKHEAASPPSEALDHQFDATAPLETNALGAPDQVSSGAPAFDSDDIAAAMEREGIGCDGKRVLARFHENWLLTGFEKALNRQVRLVRILTRGLTGGLLH